MRKVFLTKFLLILSLYSLTVNGFVPPNQTDKETNSFFHNHSHETKPITIRLETKESKINNFLEDDSKQGSFHIKVDSKTGFPRLISGNLGVIRKNQLTLKDYLDFSFSFIEEHKNLFNVSVADLALDRSSLYMGPKLKFIKFLVKREGIKIYDAEICFRYRENKLLQVVNHSFGDLDTVKLDAEQDTFLIVKKEFPSESNITRGPDVYRVSENEKGFALIKTHNYNIAYDNKDLNVQINAESGEVYELKDNHYYIEGQVTAEGYTRWYQDDLVPLNLDFLDLNFGSQTIRTDLNGTFEVDLKNKETLPLIKKGLTGQYVKIYDKGGNPIQQKSVLSTNSLDLDILKEDFSDPWLDSKVAQNMAFYHVNKMVLHAKKYINPSWFESTLIANTNLRNTCNAHWDGRTINFYSGDSKCANTGLIADVIYHEWGHGLDANTGGIQDGAFSEGLGDIMSLIMTRSHLLGVGFRIENFLPVRDLEPDKIYPKDRGEVHAEGLIIGSAFWNLYKALKDKYDADTAVDLISKYTFQGIFTSRTYLDMYDAMLLIDDDDDNLDNGSPNFCTLNSIFAKHGLAEASPTCELASLDDVEIYDPDQNGSIDPGETVKLYVSAHNPRADDLSNLKGKMKLLEPIEGIEFETSDIKWSRVPSEKSAKSTPAVLVVHKDVACGTQIPTEIRLFNDDNSVTFQKNLEVGKNIGEEEVLIAENLPAPILDKETIDIPFPVTSAQWQENTIVETAHLEFNISHSYIGDILVKLVNPEGKSVDIYRGQGRKENVEYSKDISDRLKGMKGLGEWTLKIYDRAKRDEGQLNEAKLRLMPSLFGCHHLAEEDSTISDQSN